MNADPGQLGRSAESLRQITQTEAAYGDSDRAGDRAGQVCLTMQERHYRLKFQLAAESLIFYEFEHETTGERATVTHHRTQGGFLVQSTSQLHPIEGVGATIEDALDNLQTRDTRRRRGAVPL